MNGKYRPVDPEVEQELQNLIEIDQKARINYFSKADEVLSINEKITAFQNRSEGYFLKFSNGNEVRIDRIVTFNGKPGPAIDEYESFSNACMRCDDIGQFS